MPDNGVRASSGYKYIHKHHTHWRVNFSKQGLRYDGFDTIEEALEKRRIVAAELGIVLDDEPQNATQELFMQIAEKWAPAIEHARAVMDRITGNNDPLRVESDETPLEVVTLNTTHLAVCADLHIPLHDPQMIRRLVAEAKRYGVKQLVIAGDFFDFASISRHPKDQREAPVALSLKYGGRVARYLASEFDAVDFVMGNHDWRLIRQMGFPLESEQLWGMVFGRDWPDNVNMHAVDYCYAEDSNGKWLIGHPAHYSGQGGKTPADIALIEQCNVATGHNHIIGAAQSKCGKFIGVDFGHMSKAEMHNYRRQSMTKFGGWMQGFLILNKGKPIMCNDLMMGWGE